MCFLPRHDRRRHGRRAVFLLLPIVAVFLRVPPGDLLSALGSDAALDAIRVTAETNAIAMVLILGFGTPAAYWISTRRGGLRDVVVTLVELPLVLPPAVAGVGLLVAFGRAGLLGGTVEALGVDIAFTKVAVILAVTFVASPFFVRTAVAAFESVEPTLPAAARTLGAGRGRVFFRVMLPLAAAASEQVPRSRLHEGSGSSARRSCSPAPAGRHPDPLARDLRAVRCRLRRRARDQRSADRHQCGVLLSVKLMTRWRSGPILSSLFAASTRQST